MSTTKSGPNAVPSDPRMTARDGGWKEECGPCESENGTTLDDSVWEWKSSGKATSASWAEWSASE